MLIIDYKGISQDYKSSSESILFVFGLGIVVVFLVLAAQFEIRQKRLKAARTILGTALGMAPKAKVFKLVRRRAPLMRSTLGRKG